MLLFEDRYKGNDKQAFISKVNSIAFKLGINPNWLMYVMYNESGLDPSIQAHYYKFTGCGGGYAGGLIGFTPCTLHNLGYYGGPDNFVRLSGTEQLDYVYDLFKPYAGRINNYADLHLITAFPAALGKPLDWVFESTADGITPQEYAKGNPGFDLNKDGQVTLTEFYDWQRRRAQQVVPPEYMDQFINAGSGQAVQWNYVQTHARDLVIAVLIGLILLLIGFVVFKLIA